MNWVDWTIAIVIFVALTIAIRGLGVGFVTSVSEACMAGIIKAFKREKEKEEQSNGEEKDESV